MILLTIINFVPNKKKIATPNWYLYISRRGLGHRRKEMTSEASHLARFGVQRAPRRAHYEFESPKKLGELYTSETSNRMRGGVYISTRNPLRHIGISFSLILKMEGWKCVCTTGTRAHTTYGTDFWIFTTYTIFTILMVIFVKLEIWKKHKMRSGRSYHLPLRKVDKIVW